MRNRFAPVLIIFLLTCFTLSVFSGCASQEEGESGTNKVTTSTKALKVGDLAKNKVVKATPPINAKSKVFVKTPEFDYGDIARGETATHTFIIKNTGKEKLHIKRAKGS